MSHESPFADLEIRVLARDNQRGYPVELTLNHSLEFRRGYADAPGLGNWQPGIDEAQSGKKLFDLLLADHHLSRAWAQIKGMRPQRRIRLHIDPTAPELHALPWELMHEMGESGLLVTLAASDATPFSRYLASQQAYGTPVKERPLRILVAIANPSNLAAWNLPPVDVDIELDGLRQATQGLSAQLILLDPPCTPERIEEALQDQIHVLHFIGHGAYDKQGKKAVLFLANRDNLVRFVYDDEHAAMFARHLQELAEHASLRLVFLASCQSATRNPTDAYRGFAPRLIAAGVPAVLAMQDLVPMTTAQAFTRIFYRQLLRHGLVDLASNQARAALLTGQLPGASMPALFMRLTDGQLLAPNPAVTALQALHNDPKYSFFDSKAYLPLPIDVLHLTEQQDIRSFERFETEATAAIDLLDAVDELLPPPTAGADHASTVGNQGRLVALVGGYGSNKSTQMRRLVRHTTVLSSSVAAGQLILPVLVDLEEMPQRQRDSDDLLNQLLVDALSPYWPGITAPDITDLLQGRQVLLRLLFDNCEVLTSAQRREVYRRIRRLAQTYPQHQYLLTADFGSLDLDLFAGLDLHILVLQQLERRKIRRFLQQTALDEPSAQQLLDRLDEAGLYDLAAVPWFTVKLMHYARLGQLPHTRAQTLQFVVDEALQRAVLQITGGHQKDTLTGQGLYGQTERVLLDLAWHMQSCFVSSLPTSEVLTIIKQIRGDREYGLEQLYAALIDSRLLAPEGPNAVRFGHRRLQSYFCARAILERPDRDQVLTDITASLGRLSRLRWWEETLVFASGHLASDLPTLERFLELITYGVNLGESEQTFLAARCLAESRSFGPDTLTTWNLAETVTAALIWRLSNRNEPRASQRSRAALLLGQIAHQTALRHLALVAYGKPRLDRRGEPDFDYSNVRMAAIIGLLRLPAQARKELLAEIDPVLVELLESWEDQQVGRLIQWLDQAENINAQGVAALALGDLIMRLAVSPARAGEMEAALQALAAAFFGEDVDPATRWAVSYALAIIDLPTVRRWIIDPFFQSRVQQAKIEELKCMAYLIGLLRWQDERAHTFLVDRCLHQTTDVRLAAIVIDSLGRLADRRHTTLLEQLALGNGGDYLPGFDLASPDYDAIYLRRKAVDALASIGDLQTMARLRLQRTDRERWHPELEEALYRSSEEIFWREHWSLSV